MMNERRRAFTIIEILIVVAIIVVLVAVVVAVGTSVRQSAQRRQTMVELKSLEGLLADYLREIHSLPANVTDMGSFVAAVKQYPQFEKTLGELPGKAYSPGINSVKDAFGSDILFVRGNTEASSYFRSVGPNGVPNDADDILSNEPTR